MRVKFFQLTLALILLGHALPAQAQISPVRQKKPKITVAKVELILRGKFRDSYLKYGEALGHCVDIRRQTQPPVLDRDQLDKLHIGKGELAYGLLYLVQKNMEACSITTRNQLAYDWGQYRYFVTHNYDDPSRVIAYPIPLLNEEGLSLPTLQSILDAQTLFYKESPEEFKPEIIWHSLNDQQRAWLDQIVGDKMFRVFDLVDQYGQSPGK